MKEIKHNHSVKKMGWWGDCNVEQDIKGDEKFSPISKRYLTGKFQAEW